MIILLLIWFFHIELPFVGMNRTESFEVVYLSFKESAIMSSTSLADIRSSKVAVRVLAPIEASARKHLIPYLLCSCLMTSDIGSLWNTSLPLVHEIILYTFVYAGAKRRPCDVTTVNCPEATMVLFPLTGRFG